MAVLVEAYFKLDKLKEVVAILEKKGEKGLAFNISLNDEKDQFDQNVNSYVKQTQDQRKEKAKKFYLFNGKVVWQNENTLEVIQYKGKDVGADNQSGNEHPKKDDDFDNSLPF